jgi:glycerol-3-phosphate O-acyltransferase / dihydroxyacetone phosphate acyltransferase
VYRSRDGGDPANNKKMLQRATELLRAGNALAIFPEGTSHSDPELRPFRSGAARIALAASSTTLASAAAAHQAVQIVPCGLYYTEKTRFRSSALVSFGAPLQVPSLPLNERFEPSVEATTALTEQLVRELESVTVHASSVEALQLAQRAERLLRGAASDGALDVEAYATPNVESRARTRQRLVEGYELLRQTHPNELQRVVGALGEFESFLDGHGLRVEQRVTFPRAQLLLRAAVGVVLGTVLLPLALLGVVMNLPLYPLGWCIASLFVGGAFGLRWGLACLVLSPLAAFAALAFVERATRELTRTMVVAKLWLRPRLKREIIARRQSVRDAILSLAELVDG